MNFEELLNKIHLGKWQDYIKYIPDKSIDMILTDPPYNVTQNKWDVEIDLKEFWKSAERIIKDNGIIIIFGKGIFQAKVILSNEKLFRYDLIWYKDLGTGHLNANRMPMRNHENILIFYKSLPVYNPEMTLGKMRNKGCKSGNTSTNYGNFNSVKSRNNVYFPKSVIDITNGDRQNETDHPTQKPLNLFKYLIKSYTNKNYNIVDFYSGSGTTAHASLELDRNFICFEKEEEYYYKSTERLKRVVKKGVLF